MSDEKTHTQTPEAKARVEDVEKTPVAKVVAEVSKHDSKKAPAKAEKEQSSKINTQEEDDEQKLVAEMSERAAKEHKELSSIGDLLFEQQVFAKGLVMGIQISLENMSGEDAPFTKAQRLWSMQFLNRRLVQLNRDQGTMKDRLDAADDGTKKAYIEARNSDRLRLILMGLGVMTQKKDSQLRKIGRQEVMKRFFSYAFQSTIELHGKDSGENSRFSILNQLYSLTLIDQPKKEIVQDFFKSIHMDELNKSDKDENIIAEGDDTESSPNITMSRNIEVAKDGDKPEHAKTPPAAPEVHEDYVEGKEDRQAIAERAVQEEAGAQRVKVG